MNLAMLGRSVSLFLGHSNNKSMSHEKREGSCTEVEEV